LCACYIILPNSLISTKTELCIVLWVFLVCFSLLQLLDACCVYNFPSISCSLWTVEDVKRKTFSYCLSCASRFLILSLSLSLFINHHTRRFFLLRAWLFSHWIKTFLSCDKLMTFRSSGFCFDFIRIMWKIYFILGWGKFG
jgi:hypothetical protein